MRLLSRSIYLSALTALLLPVLPAHASIITYADSTSFNAAATGLTSIGFEGQALTNNIKAFNTSTGYLVAGVDFVGYLSASAYSLTVIDGGYASPYFNFNSGASLASPQYNGGPGAPFIPFIRVSLPANVTAFAVDLMTVSPNALTFQVALQGSTFNVATANRPTRTFFGLTSDTPISSIDFTVAGTSLSGGTYGLLDNFEFGGQTPEPGTFLLIGGGLIALGLFRRRLQSQKQA